MPGKAGRRKICCPCNPAICPTPGRTSRLWRAMWGTGPATDLESGVKRFVEWYLEYYHPQS